MHVWFMHVPVVCHMPPLQVCVLLPEHCTCPALLHIPLHIPPAHAPLVHGAGFAY
jgi:hypothetical protein